MALYATGTATSPSDLLTQLRDWLQTNGWTVQDDVAEGTGRRLAVSKAGDYAVLRSAISEVIFSGSIAMTGINAIMCTAYSALAAWHTQTGGPVRSGTATPTGVACLTPSGANVAHHFFADTAAENITVVIEGTAGVFSVIGFGKSFAKAGSYTGGAYLIGSLPHRQTTTDPVAPGYGGTAPCPGCHGEGRGDGYPISYLRADVDTFTGLWLGIGPSNSVTDGYTGKLGASAVWLQNVLNVTEFPSYYQLQDYAWSNLNSETILLPVSWYANRDSGGWSLLGALPTIWYSRAQANGITSGTVISIGARNFMVFPNFVVEKF